MPTTSSAGEVGLSHLQDFIRSVQATLERLEDAEHEVTERALDDVREFLEDVRAEEDRRIEEETESHDTAVESVCRNLEKAAQALAEMRTAVFDVAGVRREEDGESWDDELETARDDTNAKLEALAELLKGCVEVLAEGERDIREADAAALAVTIELMEAVMAAKLQAQAEVVRRIEGLEPDQQELELQRRKAEEAQECAKVWRIVGAVVLVIAAIVVAVVGMGAAGPAVSMAIFLAVVLIAVAVTAAVITIVQNLGPILRLLGFTEAGRAMDELLEQEWTPALFLVFQLGLAVVSVTAQTMASTVTMGETMAAALEPMLAQVPVVSELADGVHRLLSALNPFD